MDGGGLVNVLLDTTVLIHLLKGNENAIAKVDALRASSILFTTSINIYEVMRGIKLLNEVDKERHSNALKVLTSNIHVLDFDMLACEKASEVYAYLRKKGIEIDPPDYLIAGIALSLGIAGVMTKNEKHFGKIPGLKVINY